MSTCVVSGTILDPSATAVSGAIVKFNLVNPAMDASNAVVVPKEVQTSTASDGTFSLTLDRGVSGILALEFPPNSLDSNRRYTYSIIVPNAATATLASLITES